MLSHAHRPRPLKMQVLALEAQLLFEWGKKSWGWSQTTLITCFMAISMWVSLKPLYPFNFEYWLHLNLSNDMQCSQYMYSNVIPMSKQMWFDTGGGSSLVAGIWGQWAQWTTCLVRCQGQRTRLRSCNAIQNLPGAVTCPGESLQTANCSDEPTCGLNRE